MKWYRLLFRVFVGFFAGIGVNFAVSLVISRTLALGYFSACLTTLPELVGGELEAVALQAFAFALPGAGVGAAIELSGLRARRAKIAAIIVTLVVSLIPFTVLALKLLTNMPY